MSQPHTITCNLGHTCSWPVTPHPISEPTLRPPEPAVAPAHAPPSSVLEKVRPSGHHTRYRPPPATAPPQEAGPTAHALSAAADALPFPASAALAGSPDAAAGASGADAAAAPRCSRNAAISRCWKKRAGAARASDTRDVPCRAHTTHPLPLKRGMRQPQSPRPSPLRRTYFYFYFYFCFYFTCGSSVAVSAGASETPWCSPAARSAPPSQPHLLVHARRVQGRLARVVLRRRRREASQGELGASRLERRRHVLCEVGRFPHEESYVRQASSYERPRRFTAHGSGVRGAVPSPSPQRKGPLTLTSALQPLSSSSWSRANRP
jgi:hypothetical protein